MRSYSIEEESVIKDYLTKHEMKFDVKWSVRTWKYEGQSFLADVPHSIIELLDEALKYENDLGEYCYDIRDDYIVVFVYEDSNMNEPACYFVINVKNFELEMVQDHDNNILVDEDHMKMADEYCQAMGIMRSPLDGWLDIPGIE